MSAFLCSATHTAAIAVFAENTGFGDALKIARQLRKVNNQALFCRYGDAPAPLKNIYSALAVWRANPASGAMVYALLQCLEYQCSEGDALQMPEADILGKLLNRMGRSGVSPKPGVWAI